MERERFEQILKKRIKMVRKTISQGSKYKPREENVAPKAILEPILCTDCNEIRVGLEQKIYVFKVGTPRQEWRKKCFTCKQFIPLKGPNILK